MRIAVGIIGIIAGLIALVQSFIIFVGSDLAGDAATSEAGAGGMGIGLLYVIGGAFAFGLPLVSLVVFALAGLLGFGLAAQGRFEDLQLWAVVALVLAALSLVAWRNGRDTSKDDGQRDTNQRDRLGVQHRVEPSSDSMLQSDHGMSGAVADNRRTTAAPATRTPATSLPNRPGLPVLRHYANAMRNYATFRGRAPRAEFFGFLVAVTALGVVCIVLDAAVFGTNGEGFGIVLSLFILVHALPGMAVQVRRLHDIDWSGWAILLNMVPLANILMIVLTGVAGTEGPNRFGPAPGNEDNEFDFRPVTDQRREHAVPAREPTFSSSYERTSADPEPVGHPPQLRHRNRRSVCLAEPKWHDRPARPHRRYRALGEVAGQWQHQRRRVSNDEGEGASRKRIAN